MVLGEILEPGRQRVVVGLDMFQRAGADRRNDLCSTDDSPREVDIPGEAGPPATATPMPTSATPATTRPTRRATPWTITAHTAASSATTKSTAAAR
jgi:hypothetical protein